MTYRARCAGRRNGRTRRVPFDGIWVAEFERVEGDYTYPITQHIVMSPEEHRRLEDFYRGLFAQPMTKGGEP